MPSSINPNDTHREKWWVTNISHAIVGISDLPNLATLDPGDRVDVLRHYSHNQVSQSKQLTALVKAGYLKLKKVKPHAADKEVPTSQIDVAITPAEEDELIPYYTKDEIDELLDTIYGYMEVTTITEDLEAADEQVILCDASTQNVTVFLPEASESMKKFYYIKRIDGSQNSVFIDGYDDEEIDGNETIEITVQNTSLHVVCDGGEWWII